MTERNDTGFFRLHQELNNSALYKKIAESTKNEGERKTLLTIADDEYSHALQFGRYSGRTLNPNRLWVNLYAFAYRLFGYTFIIKFLERSEDKHRPDARA